MLCLGFVFWYQADFQLPTFPKQTILGIGLGKVDTSLSAKASDLRWWKDGRESRHFPLAGSAWEDSYHGFTLKFTQEGTLQLHLSKPPTMIDGGAFYQSPFTKQSVFVSYEVMEGFTNGINDHPYEFLSDTPWPTRQDWLRQTCPLNLQIQDSDWSAFLVPGESSGKRHLSIFFQSTAPGQSPRTTQHLTFKEITP